MSRPRFKELGTGSFFGDLVYDRAVPEKHFLREMERVIGWSVFTERLMTLYRGKGQIGRPPYNPAVMLKMLVMAYLYDLSERNTEAYVNDSLSAKWFLGLAVDEAAPDHSTLTAFKRRILERAGGGACRSCWKRSSGRRPGREWHWGRSRWWTARTRWRM